MLISILILLAAIPAIAFPIVYAATANWRTSSLGKSLMLQGASIGLVFCLVLFNVFYGTDYPGREYIRLGVWSLLAIMLWTLLLTYVNAVRKYRADHRKK